MIRDLKSLFVAIKDNEAILFETNLKYFIEAFKKIEPDCRNYDYYYREFKKSKMLQYINKNDEIYFLQKLL